MLLVFFLLCIPVVLSYPYEEQVAFASKLSAFAYEEENHRFVYGYRHPRHNFDVFDYDWGIAREVIGGQSCIFVVFRGTCSDIFNDPIKTLEDLKTDLNIPTVYNRNLTVHVHKGVNDRMNEKKRTVTSALLNVLNTWLDHGDLEQQVILTGHSLGGALAQHLFAYFKKLSHTNSHPAVYGSRLFTFGAPQVFQVSNNDHLLWKERYSQEAYHFINHLDPVPLLLADNVLGSPRALLEHVFVSPKYYQQYGSIYYYENNHWEQMDFSRIVHLAKEFTAWNLGWVATVNLPAVGNYYVCTTKMMVLQHGSELYKTRTN